MDNNKASYYDILKVSPKASDEDIKHAYHSLAKTFHPDRNPQNRRMAELRFRLISEAYAALNTVEKRAAYNRLHLRAQNDNNGSGGGLFSQIGEIFWPRQKEIKN